MWPRAPCARIRQRLARKETLIGRQRNANQLLLCLLESFRGGPHSQKRRADAAGASLETLLFQAAYPPTSMSRYRVPSSRNGDAGHLSKKALAEAPPRLH